MQSVEMIEELPTKIGESFAKFAQIA